MSRNPSDFPATLRFNNYLLNYYNCSNVSPDNKFPCLPSKKYISLAVIEKEWVNRVKADQFTKGTLHGHPDEILKRKKPIELEAVLEPPEGQQSMKCVFVEGAPGVGKSTLAWELCKKQKAIRVIRKYSLIVLLQLREKRVQEITAISDLFYHDDSDLQQAVTKEVVACDGKNVLFILDGFDEFPIQLRKDSFIVELIQGKHLPACTVLVTSRPSATADLLSVGKPQIHKHIEVIGFTREYIKKYVESMLSDQPDTMSGFLKYISVNPGICGMMYVPLNCAIVLEIYKTNKTNGKPIPCTMTQLYTELCQTLLTKYLIEKNDPRADELMNISDGTMNNLPPSLLNQLTEVSTIAFEGVLKREIMFKKLPDGCDDLGFMNVSTTLYLGRKSVVCYSFLHLTLQEYLAAFYVSQLPPAKQKKLFEENLMHDNHEETHLTVMWRFVAGLTAWKDIGWSLVAGSAGAVSPFFVQCIFEAYAEQDAKLISYDMVKESLSYHQTLEEPHLCFRPWTFYDCYVVGFCIAAGTYTWNLDLVSVEGDEVVELLGYGLTFTDSVRGSICKLNLAHGGLTRQAMIHFSKFPPKIISHINDLDLCNNDLDDAALCYLSDNIIPHIATLTRLDLSNNSGLVHSNYNSSLTTLEYLQSFLPFSSIAINSGTIKLFNRLALSSNIKELVIINIYLDKADLHSLSQAIRPSSNLRKLIVGDEAMTEECIVQLVEVVISPSSIEELELWLSQWTKESANKFDLLKTNCNLISLEFHKCFRYFDVVIPVVADALHSNRTLRTLSMPQTYSVSNRLLHMLIEMLEVNQTLEKLEMSIYQYSEDTNSKLESVLQRNESQNIQRQVCIHLYRKHYDICSRCYATHAMATLDQRIKYSPGPVWSKQDVVYYPCNLCGYHILPVAT